MKFGLTVGRQAKKEIKTLDTATVKRLEDRFRQLNVGWAMPTKK